MKNINDLKQLDTFYNGWAMCWEGVKVSPEDEEWILKEIGTEDSELYLIKGQQMNEHYHLTNENAYPNDLNILVLTKYQPNKIAIVYGARWFTDIVDNNEKREKENEDNI